jgi:hypothetical protein
MKIERCYMCREKATSREHVPPRNLFPESRDAQGINYRQNLITVPSCDKHNSAKSQDDEFLMASIAGIVGSNGVGRLHRQTKVDRAIQRSKGALLDRVFKTKNEKVVTDGNVLHKFTWGTPDAARLIQCFDCIARALHYSHFARRFKGQVKPHLSYLLHDDPTPRNFTAFVTHRAEIDLRGKPTIGANPDVFCYQVTDKDENGLYLMRLCFYEGLTIHISFMPKGTVLPFNLGVQMMNDGFKTVIELEGQEYVMNE